MMSSFSLFFVTSFRSIDGGGKDVTKKREKELIILSECVKE